MYSIVQGTLASLINYYLCFLSTGILEKGRHGGQNVERSAYWSQQSFSLCKRYEQRIINICLIEILQIHGGNHSLLEYWRPWRSCGLLSPTVNSRYLPLPVDDTAVHSKFTGTHIPRMDRFLFWIYYPSSPCIV